MSVFDIPLKSNCPKFEFFHCIEEDVGNLLQKPSLFEGHVFVQNQSGLFMLCPVKIVDEKLIIFKVLIFFFSE